MVVSWYRISDSEVAIATLWTKREDVAERKGLASAVLAVKHSAVSRLQWDSPPRVPVFIISYPYGYDGYEFIPMF